MTISVVIGDEKTFVRSGLRKILEEDAEIAVVGEASTGWEALTLAKKERPDVVVLDARLPLLDSLEVTRRLSLSKPGEDEIRVILIMAEGRAGGMLHALQAGARGVIMETQSAGELLQAVRTVASGSVVLTRCVNSRLMEVLDVVAHLSRSTWVYINPSALTVREREVFGCLGEGLSNGEIAKKLGVEVSTVKSHVAHLLTKMGLPDRTRAALLAHDMDRHSAVFGALESFYLEF